MKRIVLVIFFLVSSLLRADGPNTWTAWMIDGREAILIDEQGNELQRITLPVADDYRVWDSSLSHQGDMIAYITMPQDHSVLGVNVYNTKTQQMSVNYETPYDIGNYFGDFLNDSNNFSLDDTRFVVGYYAGAEDGWRILIFDLASGEVTHTLTPESTRYSRSAFAQPLIFHFGIDTLTFDTSGPSNYPNGPGNALPFSVDWQISTNQFSENCFYTQANYGTFDPTGEVIEAGFQPGLGDVPDTDIQGDGQFVLEFYSPDSRWRQVFYQYRDFPLRNPTFVQNGERIVVWGRPDTVNTPWEYRLLLIERDGRLVDQIDVVGEPTIRSTNDGFVYSTFYDVGDWVTKLIYVNTRDEAPFAHQTVVWESAPDEMWHLRWANSQEAKPLASFLPWGNRMNYDPNCPPQRG